MGLITKDISGEREEDQGHTPSISLINKFWKSGSWLEAFILNNKVAKSRMLDLPVFGQDPLLLKIQAYVI